MPAQYTPLDSFRTVELAIEIQIERTKVAEALAARDVLVQQLIDAYNLVQQKNGALEQTGKSNSAPLTELTNIPFKATSFDDERKSLANQITAQQAVIQRLEDEIKAGKYGQKFLDSPPCYEDNMSPSCLHDGQFFPFPRAQSQICETPMQSLLSPPTLSRSTSQSSVLMSDVANNDTEDPDSIITLPPSTNATERICARNAILASLPLPLNGPPDDLQPIMIPAPLSLQEFINSGSSFLRSTLLNYRQLYEFTTSWCDEQEEHGYFLTPVFKCSTNPRVITAHRWSAVDVLHRMTKPTEFFYNKNGLWYYAGTYKAFRMEDLSMKEWEALSTETTSTIVKDTILARKNSSPRDAYEVAQLYACGALKVACVGLQCVGFNVAIFHALMDHASKYAHAALNAKSGTSAPCSRTSTPLHSPMILHPPSNGFPWTSSSSPNGTAGITEKMSSLSMHSPKQDNKRDAITPDALVTYAKNRLP